MAADMELGVYLEEIRKLPLLTPEREKELAVQILAGNPSARDEMIRRSEDENRLRFAKAAVSVAPSSIPPPAAFSDRSPAITDSADLSHPLGPSQSTSTVCPMSRRFNVSDIRSCNCSRSLLRRRFSSSGTSSICRLMATVPGRGEYLKIKQFLYCAFSSSTRESS